MQTISKQQIDNVQRNLRNFSRVPTWNTTMNKLEVNYLFEEHSNSVFCNGHLREIKIDSITEDIFKVYTVPFN